MALAPLSLDERSERLEAWVFALGLGLQPREFVRLRELVGHTAWIGNESQPRVYRAEEVRLDKASVEWALLATADVVYRLWQADSLFKGDPWRAP